MAILIRKPWVNPFGKIAIFRLFQLLVFIFQKGLYSFQNIVKDIFLAFFALKKKVRKMAILIPKPWVNSFEKMSIFRLIQLFVFITWKGHYSFQNIVKDIFLAFFALKKKVRKMAILIPKPWVNPFGKMSIFPLIQLFVFITWKGHYSFQNIVKDIFLAYFA